jgi:hypothetical protein
MSKQNIEDILDTNDSKNRELIESERGNPTNANFEKIKNAGKSLKVIVKAILIMLVCFFISGFLVLAANGDSAEVEMIKIGYALLVLSSLILNIIILVNLYDAGNNLAMVESISDDSDIKEKHISVNASRTGEIAEGGIIVYTDQNGEHGLVCSLNDLGEANWDDAKMLCEAHSEAGFTGWRLPDKDELKMIFTNVYMKRGDFEGNNYWSSTENGTSNAWYLDFTNGSQNYFSKNYKPHVRAVRIF